MPSTINFLRLIADPTRLRVLLVLEQEELSVAELQEILGMGQSRISSHLAQLKQAGAVVDRRAGKNVYYGLKSFSRNGARGREHEHRKQSKSGAPHCLLPNYEYANPGLAQSNWQSAK